jgi:hypothetical protein
LSGRTGTTAGTRSGEISQAAKTNPKSVSMWKKLPGGRIAQAMISDGSHPSIITGSFPHSGKRALR